MLACCPLLPNIKGVEWLRRYAEILLHQALEATAGAAVTRCPAPGSTAEVSWAYFAAASAVGAVSQFL